MQNDINIINNTIKYVRVFKAETVKKKFPESGIYNIIIFFLLNNIIIIIIRILSLIILKPNK